MNPPPTPNDTKLFSGVGADAPTVTNAAGGKQSASPARLDLMPALAMMRVGGVLKDGAEKYEENNWRKIAVNDHINHALIHAYAYLGGDTQDDHLGHAACRMMMALEMHLADELGGTGCFQYRPWPWRSSSVE